MIFSTDSFSHVEPDGQHAHGGPKGHALEGHKPDLIALNKDDYKKYVAELFDALNGNENGNKNVLNEINGLLPDITEVYKTKVINSGRGRGYIPITVNTPELDQNATGTLAQGKFDRTYRNKSAFRFNELSKDYKSYDPRGGNKTLSIETLAHSKTSIKSLIDKIKAFCNCGPE